MEPTTSTPGTFDLSTYEIADSAVIHLKNVFGNDALQGNDGQPVWAEVWSPGSKEGVRALHKAGLASQARLMRTMRGELDKDDAKNADSERAAKLSGFLKRFSPNFPVDPSAVFPNPKLNFISKQIEEFIGKDANFAQAPRRADAVREAAGLAARDPEGASGAGGSGKRNTGAQRSRLQVMKDEKRPVMLPEVRLQYLIAWFEDVGPAMGGGMGPAPLSHAEIRAWQQNVGLAITPWEARALREMSRAYVGQLAISDAVDCPPPYKVLGRVARAAWWTTRSTSCSGDRVIAGTLEIQMMANIARLTQDVQSAKGVHHRVYAGCRDCKWPGR
jgi:hypothetical protein